MSSSNNPEDDFSVTGSSSSIISAPPASWDSSDASGSNTDGAAGGSSSGDPVWQRQLDSQQVAIAQMVRQGFSLEEVQAKIGLNADPEAVNQAYEEAVAVERPMEYTPGATAQQLSDQREAQAAADFSAMQSAIFGVAAGAATFGAMSQQSDGVGVASLFGQEVSPAPAFDGFGAGSFGQQSTTAAIAFDLGAIRDVAATVDSRPFAGIDLGSAGQGLLRGTIGAPMNFGNENNARVVEAGLENAVMANAGVAAAVPQLQQGQGAAVGGR